MFYKNYYQYRKYEEAIVGEEYHKKILFIKEDIVNAHKLWNILKKNTIAELKLSMINGMIENHLIDKDKLTKKIYEQLKKESSYFYIGENKIYSSLDWYIDYLRNLNLIMNLLKKK